MALKAFRVFTPSLAVLKLSFFSGIMAEEDHFQGYEMAFLSDGTVECSGQGSPSPMALMILQSVGKLIKKKNEQKAVEAAEASAAEASGSQQVGEAGVGSSQEIQASQDYIDKTDDVNTGGNSDDSVEDFEGDKTMGATSTSQNKGSKRKGKKQMNKMKHQGKR